jgi:hypothetical protein
VAPTGCGRESYRAGIALGSALVAAAAGAVSDWSDPTENAAARWEAMPSTAAVAPDNVVMQGMSSRSAAVRM